MTPPETHLDELRAVPDLVAHRLADLVTPLAMPSHEGEVHDAGGERGEHVRIEMSAGGGDGVPGGHDARDPIQPASMALPSATSSR